MSQGTTQRDTALHLFRQKGLVRMRDLREAGVGAETVARLVREGVVMRVARGLYQLADAMPDPRRSFAEASALVPKGVICLTSALQFHELTLQMPSKTIVDCFRYRNKIGLDIALEGLREGLRTKRATPDELWEFARSARVWSVMRPYVEAMVADGA